MIDGCGLAGFPANSENAGRSGSRRDGNFAARDSPIEHLHIHRALSRNLVWRLRVDLAVVNIKQRGRNAIKHHLGLPARTPEASSMPLTAVAGPMPDPKMLTISPGATGPASILAALTIVGGVTSGLAIGTGTSLRMRLFPVSAIQMLPGSVERRATLGCIEQRRKQPRHRTVKTRGARPGDGAHDAVGPDRADAMVAGIGDIEVSGHIDGKTGG